MSGSSLQIQGTANWDESFFNLFNDLRNTLFSGNPHFLREGFDALKKQFHADAPFNKNNDWHAWLAVRGEKVVGRLVATFPKAAKLEFVPCGYFDCENDAEAAKALFEKAAKWAQAKGIQALKGPIDGHFFNSYRLKLPGGSTPFFGEPICPDYYHELYKAAGFEPFERWDTIEVVRDESISTFSSITMRFWGRKINPDLKIREINARNWNKELRTVHSLISQSYSKMPNFMPISFEEFEVLYDDFKYLINPKLSFFVEYKGQPVGFMIAFFDPLPILLDHQKSKPGWLAKLKTLLRLKLNRKRLLVVYVGKVDTTGPKIKGVTAMLALRLAINTARYPETYPLVCYLAEGSPTYASLPKNRRLYSQYVVYRRTIL